MGEIELSSPHKAAANGDKNGVHGKSADESAATPQPQPALGEQNVVDPSGFLRLLRLFRASWRDQPDVRVSWEDLSYAVRIPLTDTRVPNLVTSLVGMVTGPFQRQSEAHSRVLQALQPCSGVIRPGTMTLILAPPGHGKTTFLKAISGRLAHDKNLHGSVRFNGRTAEENDANGVKVKRLCAYVGQQDLLFPTLTVHETLEYAARSSLPDASLLLEEPSLSPAQRAEVEELVALDKQRAQLLLQLLGLSECTDTIVGNDLLRGVSGGQRKRVNLGEMLLTNARMLALDEVSTGLDAAVTLHIFSALKEMCNINKSAVVTALLQPTPETYALFDDIILMRDGYVMYHGPRDDIPKWLWEVAGLEVPPGVDEAGFLVDFLADPVQQYDFVQQMLEQPDARPNPEHATPEVSVRQAPQQQSAPAPDDGQQQQHPPLQAPNGAGAAPAAAAASVDQSPRHVVFHIAAEVEDAEEAPPANHAASPLSNGEQADALLPRAPAAPAASSAPAQKKRLVGALSSFSQQSGVYHSQAQASPVYLAEDLFARYKASVWHAAMQTETSLATSQGDVLSSAAWSPYTKASYATHYPHSALRHSTLNLARQWKLTKRNRSMIPPRVFQSIFLGVVFGTLFIQLPLSDFADRMGLLLYVIMTGAFANLTELPVASEARNVISKQIDAGFFPALSYTLSVSVLHYPLTIVESLIMGSLLYWIPGFYPDAGRYFFFLFVLFLNNNALSVFFRSISYVAKNPDVARQMDLPFIIIFVLFGGFLITVDKIPVWLIWLFFLSPFGWGVQSLALNEFKTDRYDATDENGERNGDLYLDAFGAQTDNIWKWMGPVYLIGFYFTFIAVNAWLVSGLKPVTPLGTRKAPVNLTRKTPALQQEDASPEPEENGNGVSASPVSVDAGASNGKVVRVQQNGHSSGANGAAAAPRTKGPRLVGGARQSFQLSALPFTPVSLVWKNITYTVPVGKGTRQLLTDISGYAAPGQMTALMGSSGAGKTTLMDVIAGRKTMGTMSGTILVNGFPLDRHSFAKLTGYVEQNDIHTGTATVREALVFSAHLRLPTSVTRAQREQFVDEVMALVGLSHLAGRVIGDAALPGLSQGQMKLVTIAVELVANPAVIFLDEPTSGLDAPSAARVMKAVQRIASTGRTVLCTIHQPSEALFMQFDRLVLLQTGGRDVYFGPLGRRGRTIVDYFEEASGYKERLPRGSVEILPDGRKKVTLRQSPANWMLDVIGASGAQQDQIADYASIWRESKMRAQAEADTEAAAQRAPGATALRIDTDFVGPVTRFLALLERTFVGWWRNGALNLTRFIMMIVFAILLGIVYLQISTEDFAGTISKLSVVFLGLSFPASFASGSAMPTLFRQRAVFYRETTIGLYGNKSFSLALFIVECPYIFLALCFFMPPFYFLVGFRNDAQLFFQFVLMIYLMCLTYSSLSQLWLALMPNMIAANIVNGLAMNLFFMFGGLFIRPSSIPIGWQWMYHLNPLPKAFNAVAFGQFYCDTDAPHADCPTIIAVPGEPPVYTYDYMRDNFRGAKSDYAANAGWLILGIGILRVLILVAMAKVSHIKR